MYGDGKQTDNGPSHGEALPFRFLLWAPASGPSFVWRATMHIYLADRKQRSLFLWTAAESEPIPNSHGTLHGITPRLHGACSCCQQVVKVEPLEQYQQWYLDSTIRDSVIRSTDRKAQIRKAFVPLTGLICAFLSEDFLRWCLSPERNLTHNLFFLFPKAFGKVRSVRERNTERERRKWRHLSGAEIGDEFCTFPSQKFPPYYWRRVWHFSLPKICTLVSPGPLEGRWVHTFRCQKLIVALFETVRVLRFPSVKCRDRGSKHRNKRLKFRLHRPSSHQNMNQINTKTIGNRKRDCAWGCARRINTTSDNHKSVRWAERTPSWFVLFDLQIFWGGVYPPSATSRTITFSISNTFWY